jgi:hypothetical protein
VYSRTQATVRCSFSELWERRERWLLCNGAEQSVWQPRGSVQVPVGETDSGANLNFYGTGNAKKRPGREAKHSPSTSAEDKKTWIYKSTPSISVHSAVLD